MTVEIAGLRRLTSEPLRNGLDPETGERASGFRCDGCERPAGRVGVHVWEDEEGEMAFLCYRCAVRLIAARLGAEDVL